MNKNKTLLLTFVMVTTLAMISSSVKAQRKRDFNHFPIAIYSAELPTDHMRRSRSEKRNKSNWAVHPDASGDSTVLVDSIDLKLPALPTKKAAAIVCGTVTDARGYLSNDKSGVYSSFTIQVEEVLKNPGKLTVGSVIEGEREGGRVQFPSGRIQRYLIAEQDMPKVGSRYVFFLVDGDNELVFEILTGYEIKDSAILPLDELPHSRAYENSPVPKFLKELKAKLAKR